MFILRAMIRVTLTIFSLWGLCHPASGACVDPILDGGSRSVIAIGGVADPAVLAILAGMGDPGAGYPAPMIAVINETPGVPGILSPQEARDYILRAQGEQDALRVLGSLSSQGSSKSLVVRFSASDPTRALSWLMSIPDDSGRGSLLAGYPESVSWEERNENFSDREESRSGRGRREEMQQGLYGIGGEETIPLVWTSGANMIYNDGVVASVPEPSSALLIGLGSLRLLVRRRRAS